MTDHSGHRWRERALCRFHDPESFFPVGTTGPAVEQTARAKAVCATPCPVIEPCLQEALAINAHGVWGGTTEDERGNFVRKVRQAVSV